MRPSDSRYAAAGTDPPWPPLRKGGKLCATFATRNLRSVVCKFQQPTLALVCGDGLLRWPSLGPPHPSPLPAGARESERRRAIALAIAWVPSPQPSPRRGEGVGAESTGATGYCVGHRLGPLTPALSPQGRGSRSGDGLLCRPSLGSPHPNPLPVGARESERRRAIALAIAWAPSPQPSPRRGEGVGAATGYCVGHRLGPLTPALSPQGRGSRSGDGLLRWPSLGPPHPNPLPVGARESERRRAIALAIAWAPHPSPLPVGARESERRRAIVSAIAWAPSPQPSPRRGEGVGAESAGATGYCVGHRLGPLTPALSPQGRGSRS